MSKVTYRNTGKGNPGTVLTLHDLPSSRTRRRMKAKQQKRR